MGAGDDVLQGLDHLFGDHEFTSVIGVRNGQDGGDHGVHERCFVCGPIVALWQVGEPFGEDGVGVIFHLMPWHGAEVCAGQWLLAGGIDEAFFSEGSHKFVLDSWVNALEKGVIYFSLNHGREFVITIGIS